MLSADSSLLGCLNLSLPWRVLCWTVSGTHTGLCTQMHTHSSPTFCWVLLKKGSSRKSLCVSAIKDLWVSIYESLLNSFFGEQSVLSLIHQSCHIHDCWAGTGKDSLIFVNWKKNRESRGKQEYSLRHLGGMGDWNWFLQSWLSVSVPVFCS